jgi:hypothetical protein
LKVRSVFKNKTDAQIKKKYKHELKKNPDKLNEAIEKKDRPNPRTFFEEKCKDFNVLLNSFTDNT